MINLERSRLEVSKVEDRLTLVKILVLNGYTARIVTDKVDGKKVTFIEYWKEIA